MSQAWGWHASGQSPSCHRPECTTHAHLTGWEAEKCLALDSEGSVDSGECPRSEDLVTECSGDRGGTVASFSVVRPESLHRRDNICPLSLFGANNSSGTLTFLGDLD